MRVRTVRAALAAAAVACLAMIGGQTAAAAGTPLTGEMLTGTALTIGTCPPGGFVLFTFTSSGAATGPYAGTYTEQGSFVIDKGEGLPSFTADFTITGAGGTVVTGHLSNVFNDPDTGGTCHAGPNRGEIRALVQYSASIAFADGTTCTDAGTSRVRVDGNNGGPPNPPPPVTVETFNSTGPFTCGNTPVSTGPKTLTFGSVTVTFDSVSALGNTTVTTSPVGPPIPAGFSLLGSYYEVSTTAVFTSATVCITDPLVTASSRLLHYPGPTDVTLLPVVPPQICSTPLTSFSPFAIVQPVKQRHKHKKGHDRDRDDDDDDDDHDDDKKDRGQFPFGPKKGH